MNKEEAINRLFGFNWTSDEEKVDFAIEGHGFGGLDGYYGLTYPGDLDDYEIEIEKINIPFGKVEIAFWNGPDDVILVDEIWYLKKLRDYFRFGDAH
jgi:hypothetical protein